MTGKVSHTCNTTVTFIVISHVGEGNIQGRGRRLRVCEQLLYYLEEKRMCYNLKEEALNRTAEELAMYVLQY
jgi:hypothetical protein